MPRRAAAVIAAPRWSFPPLDASRDDAVKGIAWRKTGERPRVRRARCVAARMPLLLLALLALVLAPAALAQTTTGNGRTLQPVGRQTAWGNFPTGGALSSDGRCYWAVDFRDGRIDGKLLK